MVNTRGIDDTSDQILNQLVSQKTCDLGDTLHTFFCELSSGGNGDAMCLEPILEFFLCKWLDLRM
jgi:hypothetical protein